MSTGGERDEPARSGGNPDRARFWDHWDRAMRAAALFFVLLGAAGLAAETFDLGLPFLVPLVVSGIILVLGLIVLTGGRRDDEA